jgi:hypothetical protein
MWPILKRFESHGLLQRFISELQEAGHLPRTRLTATGIRRSRRRTCTDTTLMTGARMRTPRRDYFRFVFIICYPNKRPNVEVQGVKRALIRR